MTVAASPGLADQSLSIERPQAVIRLVPGGGARTAKQILNQWLYLSRRGDVPLQRSERYLGEFISREQFASMAISWANETGIAALGSQAEDGAQALTTHIVVSFPPGTDEERSFLAGRAWAARMLGSGDYGGHFDYVTACHSDRPHPHIHIVVNRRAYEGHWLKISRRHDHLNYDQLRLSVVEVAESFGIKLDATSRETRGIVEPAITYAEFRRRRRGEGARGGPP